MMNNHYYLLVETPWANLFARAMASRRVPGWFLGAGLLLWV